MASRADLSAWRAESAAERALWDDRYARPGLFHGTEPNAFLVEHADELCSPALALAEGEGRNAVFLAQRGLDVTAVDFSAVGLAKAEQLAAHCGVPLRTQVADLADYVPEPAAFGAVISICAHLPSTVRVVVHPRVVRALRPGGLLLLEAYSIRQHGHGGPPDRDTLLDAATLPAEWPGLETVLLREVERAALERPGAGMAAMVQYIARKPL